MQGRKLLIVDDVENVLKALGRALMDEDYVIEEAHNGEEALKKLKVFPADIVLSDYMMPGINGLELLSKVKQRLPNTITILITGQTDLKMSIEAINRGEVFRFLLKPWDDEELKMAISIAFKYHDIILKNKRLEVTVGKQSFLLEEIEKKYPGITKIKREEDGTIFLDEDDSDDIIDEFQIKE